MVAKSVCGDCSAPAEIRNGATGRQSFWHVIPAAEIEVSFELRVFDGDGELWFGAVAARKAVSKARQLVFLAGQSKGWQTRLRRHGGRATEGLRYRMLSAMCTLLSVEVLAGSIIEQTKFPALQSLSWGGWLQNDNERLKLF